MFKKASLTTLGLVLSMLVCVESLCLAQPTPSGTRKGGFLPENGVVPDEKTAITIAEAVLAPVWGQLLVDAQRPFEAVLKGDVWRVYGTSLAGPDEHGGELMVELSRKTGEVISMAHTL
jgi:hypothetical protein